MKEIKQFDPRFKIDMPTASDSHVIQKKAAMTIKRLDETLAAIETRPSNIKWFEEILHKTSYIEAKPIIGYFCNIVPPELIRAFDAIALRMDCGNPAFVQYGEEILSGEICPLARSSFAVLINNKELISKCKALILPAACDAKRKLGEILSDALPCFTINIPSEQNQGLYLNAIVNEFERLIGFLEKITGKNFSHSNLVSAIEESQKQTAIVRKIDSLRAEEPGSLSIRDWFMIIQSSFAAVNIQDWLKQTSYVLEEIKAYKPLRKRMRRRLILTGAPVIWPNFKLLNLIEECGADIVGDTLCSGAQSMWDPVVIDEKSTKSLLRALALKHIFSAVCPCFISQGKRLNRILELIEERKADGVVQHGLRLCQLFDIETYRITRVLREKGVPFINLRTDYSFEDTEQLRVRFEAFLETLETIK